MTARRAEGRPGQAVGVVVAVDRFGNLATDVPGDWLRGAYMVEVGDRRVPVVRRYGDVAPGEGLARVGTDGFVEVALRDGSAAAAFDLAPGARVALVPETG